MVGRSGQDEITCGPRSGKRRNVGARSLLFRVSSATASCVAQKVQLSLLKSGAMVVTRCVHKLLLLLHTSSQVCISRLNMNNNNNRPGDHAGFGRGRRLAVHGWSRGGRSSVYGLRERERERKRACARVRLWVGAPGARLEASQPSQRRAFQNGHHFNPSKYDFDSNAWFCRMIAKLVCWLACWRALESCKITRCYENPTSTG